MPECTYLLTVGIIALIFIVSMTIPFASILIGAFYCVTLDGKS
jgi:hypothetical protein